MEENAEPIKRYVKSTSHKEFMLVDAASNRKIISIKKLLSERVEINSKNEKGRTAMHCAAQKGHYEVLKTLIANGAYVNCTDTNNVTPMHLAAQNNHLQAVQILLLAGANEKALTINQLRPIDYAEYDTLTWKTLKQAESGELPLAKDVVCKTDIPFVPKEIVQTRPRTPEDIAKKKMLQERNKKNKKKK